MSVKCRVHPECKATVKVNDVPVCYECWNFADGQERAWIEKITGMYRKGLLTKEDLEDALFSIGYHEVDKTFPVHI